VLAIAGGLLALHLLTANRYGIFRDEMYVVACARHLDWGYVDCPPGGMVVAWIALHLFGTSLLGLRLFPAMGGAALVWLTARLARELGGRGFAQVLAALAVSIVPTYMVLDHWLMMNAFEPLFWIGALLCAVRAIDRGDDRYWLGFGAIVGVGLEFKYSIAFLGAGVVVGLALTNHRQILRRRHIWWGVLVCALLALPNFIWQARNGFPFLELMRNIKASNRDVVRGRLAFIIDQAEIMHPVLAPLWIGGLLWLFFGGARRRHAVLGWAFLVVIGSIVMLKGKNYYVTPVYPLLFAAGAVGFESITSMRGRWLRAGYAAVITAGGAILLPLYCPVLSPENFIHYRSWLGVTIPEFEHQDNGQLPQYFADEFGWEDMAREVARVYRTLTPQERSRTTIFSNNWGDAAAIDFFGPRYGLPSAVSKNDGYWYWGPGKNTGEIVIVLHTDGRGDREHFKSVTAAGSVSNPYSRRDEHITIYLCRGLKGTLQDMWPGMKTFN